MKSMKAIKTLTVVAIAAAALAATAGLSHALNVATTDSAEASKPPLTSSHVVVACGYRRYGYGYGYGCRGR